MLRLLVLIFAILVAACDEGATISLAPKAWDIRFSYDMPEHPYAEGSGWAFDFPTGTNCSVKEGCPGVHYVTTKYANPIPVDSTLLVSFTVEADSGTVFNFKLEADNTCDKRRASVRAILQRAGDDLYGADYRFWSNPAAIVLADGEYTMTVKLSPDQWTNVNGKRSAVGFVETLKKIENIGLTFGGGCFFGHGVNVSGGTARFILIRFEVIP
jgi:hypothetical protein